MTTAGDLTRLSAGALVARLHRREISAEAVYRAHLERIKEREPQVGAWVCVNEQAGLAAARQRDAGPIVGPLHGLPVGIKDIIDTVDLPTEYGSPIYAGHRPAWDAACVAALRRAGALVLGKTVTAEFASSHPGKTRHPLNPLHTPGGSSSGSAAGVADCMVPAALGTQTGGSTIRPASYCGVVGYKPGFGLVNRHGVKSLAESLDTVGVLARSVDDAALLASVITGRPALRDADPLPAPRIGVLRGHGWSEAQEQARAVLEWSVARLCQTGGSVSDMHLAIDFSELEHAHHDVEYVDMARAMAYEMNEHAVRLSDKLRARLEQGAVISPQTYDRQQAYARQCRRIVDAAFEQTDVLLTLAAASEAPAGLAATGSAVFNRVWTLLHGPCIALPMPPGRGAPTGPAGLPIGIQLIGRRGKDRELLAAARWVEAALAGDPAQS